MDWNAKVGSQEIPGVTGKFGLGVEKENTLVVTNTLFQQHKRRLFRALDNTRWSISKSDYFIAAEDGEALNGYKNKTGSRLWLRS